jgi:hypothetical protein
MNKIIFYIAMTLFVASPVCGEVISWVDDAGVMHFTDQYSSIPPKYMNKVNIREDISQVPAPYSPPAKLKRKVKGSSQVKADHSSNGTKTIDQPRVPTVQNDNHQQHQFDGRIEPKKFRGRVNEDTRRSQDEIYNSQTDARKAANEAQRQIDKAANVGQQQINDARQSQQRAQDIINNSRNTGMKR